MITTSASRTTKSVTIDTKMVIKVRIAPIICISGNRR